MGEDIKSIRQYVIKNPKQVETQLSKFIIVTEYEMHPIEIQSLLTLSSVINPFIPNHDYNLF